MAIQQPLRRIRTLIGQDRSLAALVPEAERMRDLNRRLGRVLPSALARACRVVAVANGEARVVCDSGTAASRLRSLATSTARALSSETCPVERVRVRVQADWSRPEPREKPGLGRRALDAWDELEHELPDGDLKSAIDRLIAHHRKP